MVMRLTGVAVSGRLSPFDGEVSRGRIIHLVGPNGAGKSTLLQRMAGLLEGPGDIHLLHHALTDLTPQQLARHRGWLAQSQPVPLAMPLFHFLRLHLPAQAVNERVLLHLLGKMGLENKLTEPLTRLSGGQWQLARLIAVMLQIEPSLNPDGCLLLLDEPVTGLDVARQTALDDEITRLAGQGIAIVMSSHDLNHSLRHADDVWLMAGGRVIEQGSADAILQPEKLTPLYGIGFERLEVKGRSCLLVSGH